MSSFALAAVALVLSADPDPTGPKVEPKVINDWTLRMVRRGGFGPNGGKTISEFRVNAAGRFTYDAISGQLPKKELDVLMKAVAQADKGPAAEDAGSVAFYGQGQRGEVPIVLFTYPEQAPDCKALLRRLAELPQTYKDKK